MDYIQEAKDMVKNLDQRMNPSTYDIGWMARLRGDDGGPRWPHLIDWLLETQRGDGSWGGQIEYYHDRIICTLSAMIALRMNGHSAQARASIRRAEHYVWNHLHLLRRDPFELVGFELIVPELLVEAQALNLDVPTHTCGYSEIQMEKLKLIPSEMLYSPRISTVHSLEFLGRSANVDRLEKMIFENGSLGNSPATTAYYLLLRGRDERAIRYLEAVQSHLGHTIVVYPFRTFELTWVLNNLMFSGLPITEFASESIWEKLGLELGMGGVGADPEFGIPDGDTTAVCCRLLRSAGYPLSPDVLSQFQNPQTRIFRTYQYERNTSISTNIHALDALQLMPDYPDRELVREKIVLMLLDSRMFKMYWTDKWHASPYYVTSHALIALLKEQAYLAHACYHTVEWLLHTQYDDGSWGFFQKGTVEETAYVLTILLHYHQYRPLDKSVLRRGAEFLMREYQSQSSYPALWIEKCLYAPGDIIRSAILSALILYDRIFGNIL